MKYYTVLAALAAIILAGSLTTAAAYAQEAKWARISHVYDGQDWIPFVNGTAIPTDTPTFWGQTGGISSVQVTLNDMQVDTNKLAADGTFIKEQKTPLRNGAYTLTVRDCGGIADPPNVGACSLAIADLDDYDVLFTGTISIGSAPQEQPPTQEILAFKDIIHVLQEQIKALEDRIAELEAAMSVPTDGKTGGITTQAEPPVLQPLEPSANPVGDLPSPTTPTSVPEPGEYYIRITSNQTSYGAGDLVHFEVKLPPCPEPIYSVDGTMVSEGGLANMEVGNDNIGSMGIFAHIYCNKDDTTFRTYQGTPYISQLNKTLDNTVISGVLSVDKLIGGDYWLNIRTDYRDQPRQYIGAVAFNVE